MQEIASTRSANDQCGCRRLLDHAEIEAGAMNVPMLSLEDNTIHWVTITVSWRSERHAHEPLGPEFVIWPEHPSVRRACAACDAQARKVRTVREGCRALLDFIGG